MSFSFWFAKSGSLVVALVGVVVTTGLAYLLERWLGVSGLAMVYLLLILLASIYLSLAGAVATGLLSFFVLNFFFVEPRYSLHVASAQALIELLVFLAVSVIIVSLTERLKLQTQQAITSQQQAEAARLLAERLLKLSHQEAVLTQGAQAVAHALSSRVLIAQVLAAEVRVLVDTQVGQEELALEASAARWVVAHQQAIGAQTGNWSTLPYWCIPLQQYDGLHAVIFVYPTCDEVFSFHNLVFLQGLVDQISLALGLLFAKQREQQAMRQAERESVQHALLASLSHDFRTPLTAILGAASSLATQQHQLSEAQQDALLATIVDETAQMVDDAENILSLTRIEALGESVLNCEWQLPEEVIGVVVGRYRRRYPDRLIQTQVATDLPMIRLDLGLVAQALMNLLENATKFDTSGLAIVLSARQREGVIVFSVLDHGVGLPTVGGQDWRGKFVRGSHESAQPGFGLGLSICEAVARLHEGRLCLESVSKGGLMASLCFPIVALPEEDSNEPS